MSESLTSTQTRWLLAVDGGGSKIALAAAAIGSPDNEQRQWHFDGTGSAHPSAWAQAAGNLCRALAAVAVELNDEGNRIVAVHLALAGAGRSDDQMRVTETLKSRCPWLNSVALQCMGDIEPLLVSSVGGMRTIAVILGTGSVVATRNEQNKIVRAGGWGPLLGDACSGGAIGLSALRYVSQLIDEGQSSDQFSDLAQEIISRLPSASSGMEVSLNSQLIQTANDRTQTASLAGVVLQRALEVADRGAQELLDPHLADIVWQIRQVARRCGITDQAIQLNFSGGIALHHAALRQSILQACRSAGLNVQCERHVEPLNCLMQGMRESGWRLE